MKIILWIIVIVVALFGLRLLSIAKAKQRGQCPPLLHRAAA
jgi:hypothetical protein